jgi:aryl sulfotransferase
VSRILWLASYPKSGNTWFRIFLANLLRGEGSPVSINELDSGALAGSRKLFDEYAGVEASDLTMGEIERIRPRVYESMVAGAGETWFIKIHDALHLTADGRPLVPASATEGALYFIRNPLDVAVSFAHHEGVGPDEILARMADPHAALSARTDRIAGQLRQRLQTWSRHVESWVDHARFPVHVVRYEDMKQFPLETFGRAVRFCGIDAESGRIEAALASCHLSELQRQEAANGFREKNPNTARFFRRGETGAWRDELNEGQAARLIRDHGEVMRRFGYLDSRGRPVY